MYKNQESKSFTRERIDISKVAARGVLWKKVFLEISQNSQENTCARVSFLIKLHTPPATLLKKRLWPRCFPVNFAKFLGTPFHRTPPDDCLWHIKVQKLISILGYEKSIKKKKQKKNFTTKSFNTFIIPLPTKNLQRVS